VVEDAAARAPLTGGGRGRLGARQTGGVTDPSPDLPRPLARLADPAYLSFWRERHLCTVTTPRPDGGLHVTPMGVVLDADGRRAWAVTSRGSVKARNIRAGGEDGVPVAIGTVDGRWWTSLEGTARVSEDPAVVAEAEERYARRYRVPRPNPERVAVVVELVRALGSVPEQDPARVVAAWHEAVEAGAVRRALVLCSPDVAVGGPRGEDRGTEVMRAWLERSGISLAPQHELVADGGRVVVHEQARWRTPDAPADVPTTEPADTWVVFEVADGLITAVRRYETEAELPG
jgi:PPOX class probable F420-dependent enzyme